MNEKPYMVDNEPVTAKELIALAIPLDENFGSDGIYRTSKAAAILRVHGHEVEDNPDYRRGT